MTITIDGRERRIGLALSGGGFRAAGFHLGVMRALQRLNLLSKLDLVTCVSGGSIAGGTLLAGWASQSAALDRLDLYLRTKSIAVASVIGGILDPCETRLEKLAASYDRDLFHGLKLSDLNQGPRAYFNATNLATGNMFFFAAGGNKPEEIGDHELGTTPAFSFPLSLAVAASSAFPPVFPPLRINPDVYPPGAPLEYVTLTDGGVYDNMGINPALRAERNPLDYLIISDGGKPFANSHEPTESGAIVLKLALDIMMEQIRGLEFDRLQYRDISKKGPKPLWFSIDSREGEEEVGDARFASSISTNLTRLSSDEITILSRHGGALLAARIDKFAPELNGL